MMTITAADIKKFAPRAKTEYVMALLGNLYDLRTAGILDNSYRLAHFMGQVGHETGGFTILREDLRYTTAKQLRKTWPARFRDKSDEELKPLLRNPQKLGEAVYFGRMGNVQAGDGYDYRGGGFLQTTGREAVMAYCKKLGLEPSPSLLDDPATTLKFACLEWQQSKCCDYADENDLTKVSKAINVGSATSNVKPVGMADRQEWFARAWAIWGDKGKPDTKPVIPNLRDILVKAVAPGVGALEVGRQGLGLIQAPALPSMDQLQAFRALAEQGQGLLMWALTNWQWVTIFGVGYLIVGHVAPMVAKKVAP